MDACAYPFGGTSAIPTREKLRSSNNLGKAVSITDHVLRPVVDLIALVRHALDPQEPIVPFSSTVQERYEQWLTEQGQKGVIFTEEQRQWLDAIKDHIAKSLRIEEDDFDYAPFNTIGGLGRVHDLFGERLPGILDELNRRLAA